MGNNANENARMADVFLSYASGDRVKAGTLASLLQTGGWSVWWDRDIDGGEEWGARIENELIAARCVVVLWIRRSVVSEWVLREARSARSRQVILPVLLEPVTPPEELAEVHETPLTAWIGEERSFELRSFLERLADFLGGTLHFGIAGRLTSESAATCCSSTVRRSCSQTNAAWNPCGRLAAHIAREIE
jgi:TIR domain